ncbi:unnamed protein product [marine sediment metagenome]|uniref:Methyltransferase FkbM domain-containing protein n=1 Tax=marine sediment metagenome TaxID=412755 RepID=X1LL53_9ZZZZ
MFWRGYNGHEPEVINVFLSFIKKKKTFFDVGANVGYYSLLAACYNPVCKIYAFEPVAELYNHFREHIRLNRFSNISPLNVAVTDANREVALYMSTVSDCSSSIIAGFRKSLGTRVVTGISLDSFVDQNFIKTVDIIKIDVETAEPLVLKGMKNILRNYRPDIICEVLYGCTENNLMHIFADYDYRFYWLSPEGLIPKEKIIGDPSYTYQNYLFTPKEHPTIVKNNKVI